MIEVTEVTEITEVFFFNKTPSIYTVMCKKKGVLIKFVFKFIAAFSTFC